MAEEVVELTFDLFTLPTAQHRAGLAGLLVLVESMRRRKIKVLPEISVHSDGTVTVALTRKTLASTFNDLYDAATEERESPRKRTDKKKREIKPLRQEKRTDPKTHKEKTLFIYPQIVPKAAFLVGFGMPPVWLKLWREAIWGTLRGLPRTRIPYEERAERQTVSEANATWKELQKFHEHRAQNEIYTVNIASSIFLGAQAANAERVPFRGRADEVFLLHFWPVVMGVYAPQVIDREGGSKFTNSYVLVVPDVSDLKGFVKEFPDTTAELTLELAGFRPRGAVISLPQEGGLEYLRHLTRLARAKAQRGDLAYSIAGVDIFELEKQGNNIHMLSADRVSVAPSLLDKYEAIRDNYHDPLFKRQRILNLLRGEPWYRGFDQLFSGNDSKRFIGSQAYSFSTDSTKGFEIK
jgi:CRISPR-associated protein Cmx8